MTTNAIPPVPLAQKLALTYEEVEALGICRERTLRKMVMTGRVRKSVLRAGRTVRFMRQELIEELRQRPPRR